MPITSSTSSPPDSGFTPRKEFIRDQQSPPNTFAILALSGSNFIRLYSFPQTVVSGLQHLFERLNISIATREDPPHGLYELSIDHKPWANPKSVFSEKLLVDILAVIYRSGFNFLSCIDYGREPDDKLAMAFSKPASSPTPPLVGSRIGTPVIPSAFPAALGGSTPSLPERAVPKRIPFALSFTSTTLMRVISPPLHLTPAILQAVRGSWPRGVVSEKKVGENCFEFKLKGYKWFQQDNFAFDSLQHILTLLQSLDAQSFTLLTSLSLTNRSRVKDLWIFTGPAPDGDDLQRQPSSMQGSAGPKSSLELPCQHGGSPSPHHRRLASDASAPTQPMVSHHRRSVTEDLGRRHQENNSNSSIPLSPAPHHPSLLRKPAPRAQVPVSVIQESETGEEVYASYSGTRADLPSMVSTSVPNMTGVGAQGGAEVAYPFGSLAGMPPSPGGPIQSPYAAPPPLGPSSRAQSPSGRSYRSASDRDHASSQPSSSPPSSPHHGRTSAASSRTGEGIGNGTELERQRSSPTPPSTLLSPGTFRDSGLSDVSHDISIRWTGVGKEGVPGLARLSSPLATPKVPGGWQATPIDERPEGDANYFPQPGSPQARTPIHETFSRVESPEVVRPDIELRKSEAVVYGMIAASSPSQPPVPSLPPRAPLAPPPAQAERVPSKASSKLTKEAPPEGGQGWVLVNVEGTAAAAAVPGSTNMRPSASREASSNPMPQYTRNFSTPDVRSPPPRSEPSPAVKAIAVIDAVESRQKKSRAASANKEIAEGGSGVRRFFSLNRKNSKKMGDGEEDVEKKGRERALSQSNPTTLLRTTFRDRLRNLGTPEAVRREDKPRNID